MKRIYLDYAATSYCKPEVLSEMLPYFGSAFYNAQSLYSGGREAHAALEKARESIAAALNAHASEIFFTSGGTESDNWAIKGSVTTEKNHIITCATEHHAVLNSCAASGARVTVLPVDSTGTVDLDALKAAICPQTALISIMFANNETGTVQPVARIAAAAKAAGVPFHCDAVQAFGHELIDLAALPIDMLSLSAHKIYGPKGIGALFIRRGTHLANLIHGGAQEGGRRAGTDAVPLAAGFGKAAELMMQGFEEKNYALAVKRDRIIDGALALGGVINGHPARRLPGIVNMTFAGTDEALLYSLDMRGISVSAGAACQSGSPEPSHVLTAMGLSREDAKGSIRVSVGDATTDGEIGIFLKELKDALARQHGCLSGKSPE